MIRSLQLLRNNLVNHDNSKRSSCVCGGSVGYRQGEIILYIYIYKYIYIYIYRGTKIKKNASTSADRIHSNFEFLFK